VLADLLIGVVVALLVLVVFEPGLGVVAWFGVPVLILGVLWLLAERFWPRRRRRAVPSHPTA
jgi:hypothetical protein